MSKEIIDPNEIKVRDPLMLLILQGVTKAGIHRDNRKHRNKYRCRKSKANRTEE